MVDFDFPNVIVTGKLKEALSKIRDAGVPQKATQQWLESLGFKSKNDRPILSVLKFVKFIDGSGLPTDLWKQYRGTNNQKVLASGIKEGYYELFEMYPDAYARSNTELEHFFSTKSSVGKKAVSSMVLTFKTLCEMADFNNITTDPQAPQEQASPQEPKVELGTTKIIPQGLGAGVAININIQLTVPDTTDEAVYDKFFAALKKHLLS